MSIDLEFDDGQQAIADTLQGFCADRLPEEQLRVHSGALPEGLWQEIAELGVLATGTSEGEGGALELCAAIEALGYGVFPGPIVATVLAGQLLDGEELRAVIDGRAIVAAGCGPLFAFGDRADLYLERRGQQVHRGVPKGSPEPLRALGGEPWGRVELELGAALDHSERASCFADMSYAAYLGAAAQRLVDAACEHARVRKQFGRAIGEFQAVAHPLASCSMALAAARSLARAAAHALDREDLPTSETRAAAARLSAMRAARTSVEVSHQVFGAIGITLEGPAFAISRRIQQAVAAPGAGALRECVLRHFEAAGGSA